MSKYSDYRIGQTVLFVDENQCEVRGEVVDKQDTEHYLQLTIKQEDGSFYNALLKHDLAV